MKLRDSFIGRLFQNYYNVSKLCAKAPQAEKSLVDYLRQKLNDNNLDIRQVPINGKHFWAIARWSHPTEVFGLLAKKYGEGLDRLFVVLKHWACCPSCGNRLDYQDRCPNPVCLNYLNECHEPRGIGLQDIDYFVRAPDNYVEILRDAYDRERNVMKQNGQRIGIDFASEILPYVHARFEGRNRPVKSYGTGWMVEENERRKAEGET